MARLLIKAAGILLLSETAVMALLWYSGLSQRPIGIILDPLLMALVALFPIYILFRSEKRELDRREILDAKLHTIVDGLWSASLHTLSTSELLSAILREILNNSPISTVHKGAIFLEEDGRLILKAHEGFSDEQLNICGEIEPGRCLCGRVLETGEPVFAAEIDHRHDNKFEDMRPHGHYCFPIKSAGQVIGALNLYLEAGHARDASEERFIASVCAIIARIVEGKKLERSLFRMQKTEALNRFAAGIVHDFNNILGAIRGFSQVAARGLPPDSETASDLKEIGIAVDKGETLTRRLKLFARQEAESTEVFDLNAALTGLGEMMRRLMGAAKVELRLSEGPLMIKAVRAQLDQILMNLAANSRDAMPQGGTFSVETREQDVCFPSSKRCLKAARLTVSDTGTGMTEKQLEMLFEPFYTTKGEGEGTGLGLPVVDGIVRQHGGEIFVRSAPGKGTTFDIYLPLAD